MKPETNNLVDPIGSRSAGTTITHWIGDSPSPELYSQIASQPFFKGLSGQQIQVLADSAMEIHFEPDQWIYQQGDLANRFYLITEGKVLIESEVSDQGTVPIRILGPGDDLGWAWLFPPYYMHFSAQAIEPVNALFFYGTRLRQHCEDDHDLGYELMNRIAEVVVQNLHAVQQRLTECDRRHEF
jgi:CRP/FNR family cyclic AMP-dependent transcriptional regulator